MEEESKIQREDPVLEKEEEEKEEEINSKIWEEIDEKYEVREETKMALTSLFNSHLIDLSTIFKLLAKCMTPPIFVFFFFLFHTF